MGYLENMKHVCCMVILILNVQTKAFSQVDPAVPGCNLVYIELAGPGGYGSLNYERILFSVSEIQLGVRCGVSTYHVKDYTNNFNPDILIPISINGYYGNVHKLQVGVGQTFANIVHAGSADFEPVRKTNFHTYFSIGYQYQMNSNGVFFRIAYTPVIEFNSYFRHWAGVSAGYTF
jgi:hypothetical protein